MDRVTGLAIPFSKEEDKYIDHTFCCLLSWRMYDLTHLVVCTGSSHEAATPHLGRLSSRTVPEAIATAG